ncbi:MAG: quinone-dependent dihydroorotate dehydrogenase [Pseudomonadota bacterium]
MYSFVRYFLFKLSAERSHNLSMSALRGLNKVGLLGALFGTRAQRNRATQQTVDVFGVSFPGKVGLAAGLDKNADSIDALAALGFDFIEVGTVTPRPQEGNPLPRLFRLPEHNAIINRMGFNNKGVDYLVERVKASHYTGVLGINIGKNKLTPNDKALDDYIICMNKVYEHASYITINVSSPNTPGLRDLQFGDALLDLLTSLKAQQAVLADQHGKHVPLLVKIAPDLEEANVQQVAEILLRSGIEGVIATNTSVDKSSVYNHLHGQEAGGLSGQPMRLKSTQLIETLSKHLDGQLPIIGVGGIHSAASAQEKLDAGASLVQVYTGFIYEGPALINRLKAQLNT